MSVAALTLEAAARMMRELDQRVELAMKDKSYQQYPIGGDVARFLRAMRWSGSSDESLRGYEGILARFTLYHADITSLAFFCSPVGPEYLSEFLHRHWGDSAQATKRRAHAILSSFLKWAARERRIPYNPMDAVPAPKRRQRIRQAHPRSEIRQLLDGQDTLRDRCGLWLLTRLGLRKNDLRLLQIGDIDLIRNMLILRHAKGGDEHLLPFGDYADMREDLYLHIVGESRAADEYLIYPKQHRLRPMAEASLHRWFKRCLDRAGLPDFPMHELRHTAGDEIWRVTGNIVLAKQLLRHKSVATTEAYLHPSPEDLRAGMRLVRAAWEAEDEES